MFKKGHEEHYQTERLSIHSKRIKPPQQCTRTGASDLSPRKLGPQDQQTPMSSTLTHVAGEERGSEGQREAAQALGYGVAVQGARPSLGMTPATLPVDMIPGMCRWSPYIYTRTTS